MDYIPTAGHLHVLFTAQGILPLKSHMVLSLTSLRSLLTCYFIRCTFLATLFKKTNHPFHSPIHPVFLSCYIFLCRTLDLLSYYYCCSVSQSCPALCNPKDCNMPGFPVLHYLLEFAQTHVHWVGDAIQPSHPLSPSSPLALNLSQHQGLFHQVVKRSEFQLQHQSFQWIFRLDLL